jgi:hypothetical protein
MHKLEFAAMLGASSLAISVANRPSMVFAMHWPKWAGASNHGRVRLARRPRPRPVRNPGWSLRKIYEARVGLAARRYAIRWFWSCVISG